MRRSGKLKGEAVYCSLWRTRSGSVCGPVYDRIGKEWMNGINEWIA